MTALTGTTTTALTVTAAAIQVEHKAAQRCASEAVAHAIRAGELLIEAKAALPHGAFGAWLVANVEFSDRTAQGYMRLAKLDDEKRNAVADFSLRNALAQIAEPRPDIILRADIVARIQTLEDDQLLQQAYHSIKDDPNIDHLDEGCFLAFRVHGAAQANARMPAESVQRARRFESFLRSRIEILDEAAP